MTAAPDFMPVLSAGRHDSPAEGACVMEYVSVIAGEKFSDKPACTDEPLAMLAWAVNDSLDDSERHMMVPFITRLIGTSGYDVDHRALTDAFVAINPTAEIRMCDYDGLQNVAQVETVAEFAARLWASFGGTYPEAEVSAAVGNHLLGSAKRGEDRVAMFARILDAFDAVTGHTDAGDLTEQINQAALLVGGK